MLQAMFSGVSSLNAHQTRMNVIGNNIANVNTIGYKQARVSFQDALSQTLRGAGRPGEARGGTNPLQVGLGVKLGAIDSLQSQGSLISTSKPTDLAIQGNGFFLVSTGGVPLYTRDGSFEIDAAGQLVSAATGARVLGWRPDENGRFDTTAPVGPDSALTIPIGALTAVRQTSRIFYAGNLDATAPIGSSYANSVRVYDTLGNPRDLTVTLNRTAVGSVPDPADPLATITGSVWSWTAREGAAVVGSGGLTFDSGGQLLTPSGMVTLAAINGASAFSTTLDFSPVTQLSGDVTMAARGQDGFALGTLQSFNIDAEGVITGIFSNGLSRPLGQIALASFSNSAGLEKVSNNFFRESNNSGLPQVGPAGSGGNGGINSANLEMSNVDLGTEFTNLIITQRGFQANTRIVTTVDELLQDLIQLKR